MARANRRRTAWVGGILENEDINEAGTTLIEVIPNSELTRISDEPTVMRTIYELLHGGIPDDFNPFTVNSWFAFFLADPVGNAIADLDGVGQGDERIISSGFLSTPWQSEEQKFAGVLPLVISVQICRNQRGPWQMSVGDTTAMRKVRSADSLMLQVTSRLSGTAPLAINVRGRVRCLLAL